MSGVPFVPVHVRAWDGECWPVESIPVWGAGPVEPFFQGTVERWLTRPASLLFRTITSHRDLATVLADAPPIRVAGLVMHISRCGSTLVAQALAERPRTVVLSEPATLDIALTGHALGATLEERARLVRALALAQAAPFLPNGGDVVIKPEATHIAHLPLLRAAFPEARWVFLHRRLEDVFAANVRVAGGKVLPGQLDVTPFGMRPQEPWEVPFERYVARLVAGIGRLALAQDALSPGLFMDYERLTTGGVESIADYFQLPLDEAMRARVSERLGRDAKDPSRPFSQRAAEPEEPHEDDARVFAEVRAALVRRTQHPPQMG
ncbi:MAG: sulfotransferase [Sandaracinaceae bacterium]|nr:sulfotransferase [Sandaracinaceae bacterium]